MEVIPSHGPRDHIGDQNRDRELPEQQEDHIASARAKYLSDTDLFGAPACGECGQSEQAQAGNKDGDAYKDTEHSALSLIGAVKLVETIVQKAAPDRGRGLKCVPGPVDEG